MPRRAICAFLVCLAPAGLVAALAAEGRIPIPFAGPVVTPIVINQPGHYILTRNLSVNPGGPIIDINVPMTPGDVVLDLNGFVLDQTADPFNPVIRVNTAAGGVSEVVIRNGVIVGGNQGIWVLGNPIRKVVVDSVRINNTAWDGISITADVANVVVRNCIVNDAAGAGIDVCPAPGGPRQSIIEGNQVRNTQGGIIVCNGSPQILRNEVQMTMPGGWLAGIYLESCLNSIVAENTVREANGSHCIRLIQTSGSKLFDNVLNRCSSNGIVVDVNSSGNLVWKNVIREASNWAIDIAGDYNQIEGNVMTQNGRGLVFEGPAQNNVYRSNMARGSTGVACPAPVCADYCNSGGATNSTSGDNFMPNNAAPCN